MSAAASPAPEPPAPRWRTGVRVGAAAAAMVVAALAVENVALNLAVWWPTSPRPGQVSVGADLAWTVAPGRLHVRGLHLRGRGVADEWWVSAESASGTLSWPALWSGTLKFTDVRADGVTAGWRPAEVAERPVPARAPWAVEVVSAVVGLRSVEVGDYGWTGSARVGLSVAVADVVTLRVDVATSDGALARGPSAVGSHLVTTATVWLDGLPRHESAGRGTLRYLSGSGRTTADVDLGFLELYLREVPWLTVGGSGSMELEWGLSAGEVLPSTRLAAWSDSLAVDLGACRVEGPATIRAWVAEGVPPTAHLAFAFDSFSASVGDALALVEGEGFTIDVASDDVSLAAPFTTALVTVDLPESALPDVARFGALLPGGLGFGLTGGTATVSAHLVASSDGVGAGTLEVDATAVRAVFDDLGFQFDLEVHGVLADARLGESWYDLTGTTVELRRAGLADRGADGAFAHRGGGTWWSTIRVADGWLRLGRPVTLDTTLELRSADSSPYVRAVAQRRPLAPWIQRLLQVPSVAGRARLSLGSEDLWIRGLRLTAGGVEVAMTVHRGREGDWGALFARYGQLSFAMDFGAEERTVRLLGARRWYFEATGTDPGGAPGADRRAEREARGRGQRGAPRKER